MRRAAGLIPRLSMPNLLGGPTMPKGIHGYHAICSEPGCDSNVIGWGLCGKHYRQRRRREAGIPARGSAEDRARYRRFWSPVINGGEARIPLTRGLWALVDTPDLPLLRPFTWQAARRQTMWYAVSSSGDSKSYLHRVIMGLDAGDPRQVDHINRDGLDNRRSNLRIAEQWQNMANIPGRRGTSRFKGVSWEPRRGAWRATITCQGRQFHLGQFSSEEQAARVYDAKARELHGPFALLNFPSDT